MIIDFRFLSCSGGSSAVGVVLRRHGDEVSRLAGGVYCAQGRCDDTMNLGGIKVPFASLIHLIVGLRLAVCMTVCWRGCSDHGCGLAEVGSSQ